MERRGLLAAVVLLLLMTGGSASAEQTLRAGVASMITPVSAVKYYQQVVDYLGDETRHAGRDGASHDL